MNDITTQESKAMELRKQALALEDDSLDGFGGKSYNFIKKTRNDKFIAVENGEEVELGNTIDVIILKAYPLEKGSTSKKYYDNNSGDVENRAPDCASADGRKPDSTIENPQCATCEECPQNAWGSAPGFGGGVSRACNNYKRLIVATYHPETKDNYKIYRLDIPKMSLKNIGLYKKVCADGGYAVCTTLCTLGFAAVTDKKIQTITFTRKAVLSDQQVEAVLHIIANDSTIKELGELEASAPRDDAEEAPQPKKKAAPKEASKEEVEEDDIPRMDGAEDLDSAINALLDDEDMGI